MKWQIIILIGVMMIPIIYSADINLGICATLNTTKNYTMTKNINVTTNAVCLTIPVKVNLNMNGYNITCLNHGTSAYGIYTNADGTVNINGKGGVIEGCNQGIFFNGDDGNVTNVSILNAGTGIFTQTSIDRIKITNVFIKNTTSYGFRLAGNNVTVINAFVDSKAQNYFGSASAYYANITIGNATGTYAFQVVGLNVRMYNLTAKNSGFGFDITSQNLIADTLTAINNTQQINILSYNNKLTNVYTSYGTYGIRILYPNTTLTNFESFNNTQGIYVSNAKNTTFKGFKINQSVEALYIASGRDSVFSNGIISNSRVGIYGYSQVLRTNFTNITIVNTNTSILFFSEQASSWNNTFTDINITNSTSRDISLTRKAYYTCQGTLTGDCVDYTNPSTCNYLSGCTGEKCLGTYDCSYVAYPPYDCNSYGCDYPICQGTTYCADIGVDSDNCYQNGCAWCSGSIASCANVVDENACNWIGTCVWNSSTSTCDDNSYTPNSASCDLLHQQITDCDTADPTDCTVGCNDAYGIGEPIDCTAVGYYSSGSYQGDGCYYPFAGCTLDPFCSGTPDCNIWTGYAATCQELVAFGAGCDYYDCYGTLTDDDCGQIPAQTQCEDTNFDCLWDIGGYYHPENTWFHGLTIRSNATIQICEESTLYINNSWMKNLGLIQDKGILSLGGYFYTSEE